MSKLLRWGGIYFLLLMAWAGIGAYNQQQRQVLTDLLAEKTALEQKYNLMTVNQIQQTSPHRLYNWASQQGFVPLSQGKWLRKVGRP